MLATLVAYLRACEEAGLRPRFCLQQDRPGTGGRCRPVPDDCQDARGPQARRPRRRGLRRGACHRPAASVGVHLGAHDGQARSVGEHAAHHHRLRRRGARRRGRRHGAALHVGARPARRLRPAHRPQHAPRAAGGELARPRYGSCARRLVHREDHGRAGAEELGAVPGDRGQRRHGRRAGERVHPGRDRQERRRGPRHSYRSPGADRRLDLPAPRRRRRQGRPAPSSRPDRRWRHLGRAAAAAAPGRAVRAAARRFRRPLGATGKRPQVFLACLGDLAAYSARATWARNFLAAGGIEAIAGDKPSQFPRRGQGFRRERATLACTAPPTRVYAELAEATAATKAAGAAQVLLAGRPKPQEAALQAAGVDTFIFAGGNAIATLARIYDALGIPHPLRL